MQCKKAKMSIAKILNNCTAPSCNYPVKLFLDSFIPLQIVTNRKTCLLPLLQNMAEKKRLIRMMGISISNGIYTDIFYISVCPQERKALVQEE